MLAHDGLKFDISLYHLHESELVSASEVTTLWRYTNMLIIIIIIISQTDISVRMRRCK